MEQSQQQDHLLRSQCKPISSVSKPWRNLLLTSYSSAFNNKAWLSSKQCPPDKVLAVEVERSPSLLIPIHSHHCNSHSSGSRRSNEAHQRDLLEFFDNDAVLKSMLHVAAYCERRIGTVQLGTHSLKSFTTAGRQTWPTVTDIMIQRNGWVHVSIRKRD